MRQGCRNIRQLCFMPLNPSRLHLIPIPHQPVLPRLQHLAYTMKIDLGIFPSTTVPTISQVSSTALVG